MLVPQEAAMAAMVVLYGGMHKLQQYPPLLLLLLALPELLELPPEVLEAQVVQVHLARFFLLPGVLVALLVHPALLEVPLQ